MNDEDFWTVWKQRHSTIAVQFLTAFGRLSGLLKKYGLDGQDGDGHRQAYAGKPERLYAYMEKARLIDLNREMTGQRGWTDALKNPCARRMKAVHFVLNE